MDEIAVVPGAPAVAARQAAWIAALEPWRSLGYGADGLARFLRRTARGGGVALARQGGPRTGRVVGVLCRQEGVLLGDFISLLAVRADAAGRGVGRALVTHVEESTARRRRWLFVSADAGNRGALAFYRKLGFARVGRLPDLIEPGHTEILLRKGLRRPG
ncbi:MAG TPA: GNAT family N-acetyltransferase [Polyangia bacterium]